MTARSSGSLRTSSDPGDDYITRHFFGLLRGGSKGWEPKLKYD